MTKKAVEIDGEKYKDCSRCGQTKEVGEFGKRSKSPDGLEYWCKTCRASYHKDHYGSGSSYTRPSRPKKGNELDYFTKLGLTSFIEGFSSVFDKAMEEYLCSIKDPYREQLRKMLQKAYNESVLPAIQRQIPQQHISLQEEVKKLQRLLLEKDGRIGDLEEKLQDEKEYREDLQKGRRSM